MAIKDVGKFTCHHKKQHKSVKNIICEWCNDTFERPSCWPNKTKLCSSWCSRRFIKKNYSGENSKNWNGGLDNRGYKRVGSSNDRRLEHRVIMEEILGRKLLKNEWVHHINGINSDNKRENLMLVLVNHHYTDVNCPHCNFKFGIK